MREEPRPEVPDQLLHLVEGVRLVLVGDPGLATVQREEGLVDVAQRRRLVLVDLASRGVLWTGASTLYDLPNFF